jgi:hypothetical protein
MPSLNNDKLTSAELTELHAATVNAARASRTLTNISRRAARLLSDGYQVRSYEGTHFHEVTSPKGDRYGVWHGIETGYFCSCPCFAEWNTCKHLEAIDLMLKDAADAAVLDSMEDAGYDPYAYRY